MERNQHQAEWYCASWWEETGQEAGTVLKPFSTSRCFISLVAKRRQLASSYTRTKERIIKWV